MRKFVAPGLALGLFVDLVMALVFAFGLGGSARALGSPPAGVSQATLVVYPQSGWKAWEVGGAAVPAIWLHGYGSNAREWFPFVETIRLPRGGRFIFPEGIEATVPPHGPANGRAWWQLELDSYVAPGVNAPDMSSSRPVGLGRASAGLLVFVREMQKRLRTPASGGIILGGFSQGAMVASETAFRSDVRLRALVLLSGTIVDEPSWTGSMAKRRGLPVFIAHGRKDGILPFAASQRLADRMRQSGLAVTFVPFDGGHEIPADVVVKLNDFLARI